MASNNNKKQWYLKKLILVNWGGYSYAEFEPACGPSVTLFTGESGSGKSTLLDAHTSLLFGSGFKFNLASNASSNRSDYSYVLGANGSEVGANGRTHQKYLRGIAPDGSPARAFSLLCEEYECQNCNEEVSNISNTAPALFETSKGNKSTYIIGKCFTLKEAGEPSDLKSVWFCTTTSINLKNLTQFLARDTVTERRICNVLGEESTLAFASCKLFRKAAWEYLGLTKTSARFLHKMQSGQTAKSVNDVFSDGVLPQPQAVEAASGFVDMFDDKAKSFRAIEENQARLKVLEKVSECALRYESYKTQFAELSCIDVNRAGEAGVSSLCKNRITEIATADVLQAKEFWNQQLPVLERKVELAQATYDELFSRANEMQAELNQSPGAEKLRRLEAIYNETKKALTSIKAAYKDITSYFKAAKIKFPSNAKKWAKVFDDLNKKHANETETMANLKAASEDATVNVSKAKAALKNSQVALSEAKRSGTRLPVEMRQDRDTLANAVGLSSKEMPYLAEIVDLCQGSEQWRLAMNSALSGVARKILIDKKYKSGFACRVSTLDRTKIHPRNWVFVDPNVQATKAAGMLSANLKCDSKSALGAAALNICAAKANDAKLVSRIDDEDEMRQVQADGQIKDGNRGRYGTKGTKQIIGFADAAFIKQLEREVSHASEVLEAAQKQRAQIEADTEAFRLESNLLMRMKATTWENVDAKTAEAACTNAESAYIEAREQKGLKQQHEAVKAAWDSCKNAQAKCATVKANKDVVVSHIEAANAWPSAPENLHVPEMADEVIGAALKSIIDVSNSFEERALVYLGIRSGFGKTPAEVLEKLTRKAVGECNKKIDELSGELVSEKKKTEEHMTEYIERFAAMDDRFAADVSELATFNEELARIKRAAIKDSATRHYADAVSSLEQLLQEVEFNITADKRRVLEELEKVNKLIENFPFGREAGKLSIQAKIDEPSGDFMRQVHMQRTALENWSKKDQDEKLDTAKSQFVKLTKLTEFFKDALDKSALGKRSALDARTRATFIARVEVEGAPTKILSSTGARSGGETQELMSFIYAAALLYLLDAPNLDARFTTAVMDEAMGNADANFTRRALELLPGLGFQAIASAVLSKSQEIMSIAQKTICTNRPDETGILHISSLILKSQNGENPNIKPKA